MPKITPRIFSLSLSSFCSVFLSHRIFVRVLQISLTLASVSAAETKASPTTALVVATRNVSYFKR